MLMGFIAVFNLVWSHKALGGGDGKSSKNISFKQGALIAVSLLVLLPLIIYGKNLSWVKAIEDRQDLAYGFMAGMLFCFTVFCLIKNARYLRFRLTRR